MKDVNISRGSLLKIFADEPITAMTVKGYKSIHDNVEVGINPLTVLAGPNSSGKSSIMQPVLLLKQTLEESHDPGVLSIWGPHVKFTDVDQLLSHGLHRSRRTSSEVFVSFTLGHSNRIGLTFRKRRKTGLDLFTMDVWKEGVFDLSLSPGMHSRTLSALLPRVWKEFGAQFTKPMNLQPVFRVERDRCFLALTVTPKNQKGPTFHIPLLLSTGNIEHQVLSIIHLPGLRGNPERMYRTPSVGDSFRGTFETYVSSVIAKWQKGSDTSRLSGVSKDLQALGLTWKVHSRKVNSTQAEIFVGRLLRSQRGGASDLINIADVGLGVSQALPLVVALHVARKNQMVFVEQPEIHLHPKAQIALGQVFARAVERGVILVIETHSSLVLRGIQTAIAKGRLQPEEVMLHWFQRNPLTGMTKVSSVIPGKSGSYGDWPSDFDDVNLESENAYLDAVESAVRK